MFLLGIAYAMGTSPAGTNGAAEPQAIPFFAQPWFMIVIMVAIMYFFLWLPQKKERKKHAEKLKALKKGDKIITTGGIHGIVANAAGDPVKVKIADNVKIDISRSAIAVIEPAQEESKEV
ncbi:MAG: preprotein translocase subunit YajC [bacterium]|nr:preprotein translocase subunit YajC [bacterium]